MSELEENIKATVNFHNIAATGFYTLKCPVCNDNKVRGGFKFESDKIIYQCFRGKCDATTVYEYEKHMPKKFRYLMDLLNVDIPLDLKFKKIKKQSESLDEDLYEPHTYKSIELLSDFRKYCPDKYPYFDEFLLRRHANFKQGLYVGTKDQWKNRLIIPFYHRGTLIGWQGVNEYYRKLPYLNSSGNSDILFVNTKNGYIPEIPIIVEGIFDAIVLPDGIATLGNTITKKQAYILRHSKPILVPDRKDSRYIEIAKKYGWRVSIPHWKVKDTNAAVQKYGIFVTARMIHDGIEENLLKAETRYRMWKQ